MNENRPAVNLGEVTFEDNVYEVLSTLPKPIQDFLTGPERDETTIEISNKYNLHADQAGRFQKAFLFMLMGIFSPEEFVTDLMDIGIPESTVKSLATDVNEMVFKPLREKEKGGSVAAAPVPVPKPIPAPQPVATPTPALELTPAPYAGARPQPLTPFNLPGANAHPDDLFRTSTRTVSPVQTVSPAPQPVQMPATPVAQIPTPPPVPPPIAPAQMPVEKIFTPAPPTTKEESLGGTLRTMATDMLAVNEHREPEPIQYKGTMLTPPMLMEKIPELTPVPQKPSVPPPAPIPQQASIPPSIRPVARPTVTPSPSNELIKEYSSDPYREPV